VQLLLCTFYQYCENTIYSTAYSYNNLSHYLVRSRPLHYNCNSHIKLFWRTECLIRYSNLHRKNLQKTYYCIKIRWTYLNKGLWKSYVNFHKGFSWNILICSDGFWTMKSRLWWAGHIAQMGEDKKCIQNSVGQTSWKTAIWKTEKEMGLFLYGYGWNCFRIVSDGKLCY
jgi:hypothetical protein